ncbi:hypothetical protein [Rhodoferax sp.]|uniref:hypothetical protein n=1 Tax=Rhodoferax sp. TaxID=50421 RepID=UPI00374CEB24
MKVLLSRAGIEWPADLGAAMVLGEYLSYRVGAYLLLNVVEDPAWLAWAFC